MQFFRVRKKDLHEILELIRNEFPYYTISPDDLRMRIDDANYHLLKLVEGSTLQGYVEAEILDPVERGARINGIVVKKEFRRKGLGTRLLQEMLEKLKAMEMRHVVLVVETSNEPAKNLYQKLGFKPLGVRGEPLAGKEVEEWLFEFPESMETPSYVT
ncbi:MAG: GNAT family N-acetyltransferase [Candidatus Diapherotrites archaeon]|nr:GNAT family N-acetyltransferase [Candidatus Diapherotrites archaeon]